MISIYQDIFQAESQFHHQINGDNFLQFQLLRNNFLFYLVFFELLKNKGKLCNKNQQFGIGSNIFVRVKLLILLSLVIEKSSSIT